MGVQISCYNPATGQVTQIDAEGVSASGGAEPVNPSLGAQKINLSIMDVQQTIQDGRARGFKPFSLYQTGLGYPDTTQTSAGNVI